MFIIEIYCFPLRESVGKAGIRSRALVCKVNVTFFKKKKKKEKEDEGGRKLEITLPWLESRTIGWTASWEIIEESDGPFLGGFMLHKCTSV